MSTKPDTRQVITRGLRGRCPHCGQGRLFEGWLTLRIRCSECGWLFEVGAGDTWAILYLSTAGFTGVLIIAMLLIRPSSILVGRLLLVPAAIAIIVATLPARKGAAVAIGYLLDPDRAAPDKFPQNG